MPSREEITTDGEGQLVVTRPLVAILNDIANKQTEGFATLQEALRGKADKADLASIDQRVARLEESRRRDRILWSAGQKIGAAAVAACGIGAALVEIVQAIH